MEFDTIWTDEDDNVWAAKAEPQGVRLFTIASGSWTEVTTIPNEAALDLEEAENES